MSFLWGIRTFPSIPILSACTLKQENVYLYAMGQGTINSSIMPDQRCQILSCRSGTDNNAFQYAKQSWTPETGRYGRTAAVVYAE